MNMVVAKAGRRRVARFVRTATTAAMRGMRRDVCRV